MIRRSYEAMRQKGKQSVKEHGFLLKPTLILAAVYLLGISAILRANVYYMDDMERACWGWPTWNNSRHLSNFLSKILSAGDYLADISPMPQLLAVCIIALTSVLAIYLISGDKKITPWQLVAAVPIGLSPYFLSCLSYKYDAPYMAVSLLLAILPLLACGGKPVPYILYSALGTIGMCISYQASSGLFPILVILVGLRRWIRGEKTASVLKFYGISAVGYFVGILFYRVFLLEEIVGYASSAAASLPTIISSYKRYIAHFLMDFKPLWLVVSFLVVVCFLYTAVSRSRQNKVLTFFVVSFAMGIMFLLSYGVSAFVEGAVFAPRTMYGIGCLLAFWEIFAVTEEPRGHGAKLACLVLSWCFFSFSFAYGNALAVQAQYTDFRISAAAQDVAKCEALESQEDVTLQITGSIGYAPGVENLRKEYPIIGSLIEVTFVGDGWWGEFGIRYYYGLPDMKFADTYDPPEGDFTLVAEGRYHTVWERENYIWIDLH